MENLDDEEIIEEPIVDDEPVEETYTEKEIVEDGIRYRVVEDSKGNAVLKEALQETETVPPPSPMERIAQLEAENMLNMMALVELHMMILQGGGSK